MRIIVVHTCSLVISELVHFFEQLLPVACLRAKCLRLILVQRLRPLQRILMLSGLDGRCSDDVVLVGSTGAGMMLSATFGTLANASDALLIAYAQQRCSGDAVSSSCALPDFTLTLLWHPLHARDCSCCAALWGNASTHDSMRSRIFSITLAGRSQLVLRGASRGAYTTGSTNVTLGSVPCNISAVSADGEWAVVGTPTSTELCRQHDRRLRICHAVDFINIHGVRTRRCAVLSTDLSRFNW